MRKMFLGENGKAIILKVLLVAFLIAGGTIVSTLYSSGEAQASTCQAGENCYVIGNTNGIITDTCNSCSEWYGTSGKGGKTAWETFLNDATKNGRTTGWGSDPTNNAYKSIVSDWTLKKGDRSTWLDVGKCRISKSVWWIGHNGDVNFRGMFFQIYNGNGFWGRPITMSNTSAPISTAEVLKKLATFRTQGTSIICSYSIAPDLVTNPNVVRVKKEQRFTETPDSYTKTAPYVYYSEVRPRAIEGRFPTGSDFEYQKGTVVKTHFGRAIDEINKVRESYYGDGMTVAEIRAKVDSAIARDLAEGNYSTRVVLSEKNKAGIANGGILDFSEKVQYRTISTRSTLKTSEDLICNETYKFNPKTGQHDIFVKRSCGSWHNKNMWYIDYNLNKSLPTDREIGFRQLLGVTCNTYDGYILAMMFSRQPENARYRELLDLEPETTNHRHYLIWGKKYDSRPSEADLDFGRSYPIELTRAGITPSELNGLKVEDLNSATKTVASFATRRLELSFSGDTPGVIEKVIGAKTAFQYFYDKECPVQCVPDKSLTPPPPGTSEQPNNPKSPYEDDYFRNSYEIFRDNKGVEIPLLVSKPVDGSLGFRNTGRTPISTTFISWSLGTPETRVSNSKGGRVEIKAIKDGDNSKHELFQGNTSATSQRNGVIGPYSNSRTTKIQGFYNRLEVGGTWASEKDRPQVLNILWEYRGSVSSKAENAVSWSRNGSFTGSSTFSKDEAQNRTTRADVKCSAMYNGAKNTADWEKVWKNTGFGVENRLEADINNPAQRSFDELVGDGNNLVLNFVRAVSG